MPILAMTTLTVAVTSTVGTAGSVVMLCTTRSEQVGQRICGAAWGPLPGAGMAVGVGRAKGGADWMTAGAATITMATSSAMASNGKARSEATGRFMRPPYGVRVMTGWRALPARAAGRG